MSTTFALFGNKKLCPYPDVNSYYNSINLYYFQSTVFLEIEEFVSKFLCLS